MYVDYKNGQFIQWTDLSTDVVRETIAHARSKAGADKAMNTPGGVDFNAKNMGLNVDKEGKGIAMKFDPAMVAEFQKGNFTGVEGIILRIVPIQSPLPFLGLEPSPDHQLAQTGA